MPLEGSLGGSDPADPPCASSTAAMGLRMVKDVDGMISRLPAARGSKVPSDGELSALEEEVMP